MLKPKWSELGNVKTWVYALGQAFFSLSLAGSGTIVYGSYLKKDEDVIACARNVAIFDTLAALLSAFVILPAVFAFQLDPSAGPAVNVHYDAESISADAGWNIFLYSLFRGSSICGSHFVDQFV